MTEFLANPLNTFLVGLGIAVVLAGYVWFKGVLNQRELRRELKALKEQLHRQMTILDKGNQQTQAELEELRKQNENLRITAATLKSKPGRAELQTLQVYEQALRLMQKRAPGFAPAWEDALAEAQRAAAQADTGIIAMVRNVFRPSRSLSEPRQVSDLEEPDPGEAAETQEEHRDNPGA
jgi:hypothetical protein